MFGIINPVDIKTNKLSTVLLISPVHCSLVNNIFFFFFLVNNIGLCIEGLIGCLTLELTLILHVVMIE